MKQAAYKTCVDFGIVPEKDGIRVEERPSDTVHNRLTLTAWRNQEIKMEISVEQRAWNGGYYIIIEMSRDFTELKINK